MNPSTLAKNFYVLPFLSQTSIGVSLWFLIPQREQLSWGRWRSMGCRVMRKQVGLFCLHHTLFTLLFLEEPSQSKASAREPCYLCCPTPPHASSPDFKTERGTGEHLESTTGKKCGTPSLTSTFQIELVLEEGLDIDIFRSSTRFKSSSPFSS